MFTERRRPQRLNRSRHSWSRHRARATGTTPKIDIKLELQTNSWLRIGLSAKDKTRRYNNLFCHFTVANLREAFHALDGSKAVGIEGITKREYSKNLEVNLESLVNRLHKGTYRPRPKRGAEIPKVNGKTRPIAISEFEDKLVEWVLAKLLSSVYEPIFIRNSFGFRPRRGAHDAIKATYQSLKDDKRPYVVEIDLASFFDTVAHRKLHRLLRLRITDRRIHSLIARFLKAGVLDQCGNLKISETGTPQGSIMSPVLANVFLHYVLDDWFLRNFSSRARQYGIIIRYADDAIFIFDAETRAENFRAALKERLGKFGLTLNEDKSGLIKFGKRQGNVFHFLGFTFFWSKDHASNRRKLRAKTSRTTLFKKIQDYQTWIRKNRSRFDTNAIWRITAAKLRGHYNYYGVHTNRPKLNYFYYATTQLLFKWLNRRSQRKSFTWERFARRLQNHPLPVPPLVRSLVKLEERSVYVC
jgi:RNA-directed DNA polymerase